MRLKRGVRRASSRRAGPNRQTPAAAMPMVDADGEGLSENPHQGHSPPGTGRFTPLTRGQYVQARGVCQCHSRTLWAPADRRLGLHVALWQGTHQRVPRALVRPQHESWTLAIAREDDLLGTGAWKIAAGRPGELIEGQDRRPIACRRFRLVRVSVDDLALDTEEAAVLLVVRRLVRLGERQSGDLLLARDELAAPAASKGRAGARIGGQITWFPGARRGVVLRSWRRLPRRLSDRRRDGPA
jgi:hypothetical protein